jgi:diguanylate cyclase (GGDEF)-like protein
MSSCLVAYNQSVTVFVIDSPTQDMDPLIRALEDQGYVLHLHRQSRVNLAAVTAALPDLILVNLRASGAAGYQLCEALRATPDFQDVPVIFVGSAVSKAQSILALRSGGSDYFTFPLRVEESVLRLTKHLQVGCLINRLKADNAGLSRQLRERDRILNQQESLQLNLTQQNRELQRLAFIDGLTQVANRRGFNQYLTDLWAMMARTQQSVALLLCDVDHFKRYNDSYGHPAGDHCLQMVATVLASVVRRATDFVARYGGEEFALLLPSTSATGAAQVAQEIQSELAAQRWPHKASPVKPFVSISIGVGSLTPSPQLAPDLLVRLADEALYAAKLQGRDRVVIANSPRRQPLSAPEHSRQLMVSHG